MEENKEKKASGRVICVWFQNEVADALEKKVRELARTRSWLINFVMREKLGFPPDEDFKGREDI